MVSELKIEVRFPPSKGIEAAEQELSALLGDLQTEGATINRQTSDGEMKHWLETASLVVGIVTSSISALKVIYDWVKDKKAKDEETHIIIFVDNRQLNLTSNRQEILAVLASHIEEQQPTIE